MNQTAESTEDAMTGNPRSSIVLCVYNRGTEVQTCLQSMLQLTDRDFEIILVDDCSTDDTPEQLRSFRASHPDLRVTIVRNATNLGVSGARNAGIDAAKGDFVVYTDSDCMVEPQWLERLIAPFHEQVIAAVGGAVVNPPPENYAERAYVGRSRIVRSIAQNRSVVGCNMAFRREVILRFHFDSAMTYGCDEDDIVRRMLAFGHRVAFAPDAVVNHHHRHTTRSYMRMGYKQGGGAARHWYKHGTYIGRDLLLVALAVLSLPLILLDQWLAVVPAAFAAAQLAAIAYNEYALKGKGLVETFCVYPMALLYYGFKTFGYARTMLLLLLGGERGIRASKASWKRTLKEASAP